MTISEKIKKLRIAQGLTQAELAKGVNVSRTLINKYENGAATPTEENITLIASFLGVDYKYLMSEQEQEIAEKNDLKRKLFIIISLSCALLYIVLYFVPMYGGYYYIYPIPEGQSMPAREFIVKSSFEIFKAHNVVIGYFGILVSLIQIMLSFITLKYPKLKVIKTTTFISLIVLIILAILTCIFSIGFTR